MGILMPALSRVRKPAKDYWGNVHVMHPSQVPLFMDSWFWCAGPENDDLPPKYDGEMVTAHTDGMNRICINRHQGTINAIYMDYTVRKVPLKSLWKQRWHRSWRMDWPLPEWPEWMQQYPDP